LGRPADKIEAKATSSRREAGEGRSIPIEVRRKPGWVVWRKSESRKAWLHWTGFGGKTLWDWLQLLSALAIPVVLAGIGVWFTAQQDARQLNIEEQRAQDAALQAYLDQIGRLMLEKDLRNSEGDSEARTLAQARTLTVLRRLDPERKAEVVRFLGGADLVQRLDERPPIIRLSEADLREADLTEAHLRGADLSEADLRRADLSKAFAEGAVLSEADLRGADLREADLRGANLSGADLGEANVTAANLRLAHLGEAEGIASEELSQHARSLLVGATLPDGTTRPGRYATYVFEPTLSFGVSDGWWIPLPEDTRMLGIESTSEGVEGGLVFFIAAPSAVFEPSSPSELKEVPAPENAREWASWFRSHPHLDTSNPVSVTVGGVPGVRIDATASYTPENYPRDDCGDWPCVPLFPLGENSISSFVDKKDRFVIADVEDKTVIIDASDWADRFDEFAPVAQKVLGSVKWERP
jgi:uncharacterized protein YjbI with pentapeptide repeats